MDPIRLEGVILSYVDGGTPKYRVFASRDRLVAFVGARAILYGRHDDHWNDSVIEGKVTVIDDGIKVEYDEDTDRCAESEDSEARSGTPEGDQELDDPAKVAGSRKGSGKRAGAKERGKHHGCEYRCTEACQDGDR